MTFDRTDLPLDLIREFAENALIFVEGLSLEDFLNDPMCRYAVAMCLLIVGENAARLVKRYPDFVAAHPETPWSQAVGMRNRIAHGYDELDFAIVWRTVTQYLPELLRTLPVASSPEPDL